MTAKTKNGIRTIDIAMVGVFAAVTYLGVQIFRIPIGFTPGVPFVHFGNIFLFLSALLLGPKKGAVAGTLGFLIFDVLNGYLQVMPKVLVCALLMCYVAARLFGSLRERMSTTAAIVIACAAGFLISHIGDFLYDLIMLMAGGSAFSAAAVTAFAGLLATFVNAVFGLVAIPLLYPLLKKAMERANLTAY